MSVIAIQPHLINDDIVVIDDFKKTAKFQYLIEIGPAYNAEEPIYYKSADEVIELSERDEYNQSMFWIENYDEKIVWILLKGGTGHLKVCVDDIDTLKTPYIKIYDFASNETWKTVDNTSIFVDYCSIKNNNKYIKLEQPKY